MSSWAAPMAELATHGSRRPRAGARRALWAPEQSVGGLGPRSAAVEPPRGAAKSPTPPAFGNQAPRGTLLTTDVSSAHSLVAAALLPFSQRRPPLGEVRSGYTYYVHARTHGHARTHAHTHARTDTSPHPIGQAVLRREFCGSFGRVEIVASPAHAFDEPEIQLRAHAA